MAHIQQDLFFDKLVDCVTEKLVQRLEDLAQASGMIFLHFAILDTSWLGDKFKHILKHVE